MMTEYSCPTYDDYCALIYGAEDTTDEPAYTCPTCGEKWYRDTEYRGFEADNGEWCSINPAAGNYCPCCMFDHIDDAALVAFAASSDAAPEIVRVMLDAGSAVDLPAASNAKIIRSLYAANPGESMDIIKEVLHDQLPMEELINRLNEQKEVRKGA